MNLFKIVKLSIILIFSGLSFTLVSQVGNGVEVESATDNGVYVENAGEDGVFVSNAGRDGVYVFYAGDYSMNMQGIKNLNSGITGHIAQIYNRAGGGNADVLALRVGQTSTIGASSNFITFYNGSNQSLGAIEGNGNGGVKLTTTGNDFAEYMPILKNEKDFSPGDVVGVVDGKITMNTAETNKVMVITDRPIVVGNMQEEESDHEIVGFIGQVPVKVRGKVNAGDWIVASELNDGTAISVGTDEITLDHKIVGQAWESNDDLGIKRVNTAIGLDQSTARDNIMRNQQSQITDLQSQINELKKLIGESSN